MHKDFFVWKFLELVHCNNLFLITFMIDIWRKLLQSTIVLISVSNQLYFLFLSQNLIKPIAKLKTKTLNNARPSFLDLNTLFESENKRQKIEPVPIPLPRASRNFPDVKTRNQIFFHNWTSEIIPFICFGMQMDRT